MFIMEHIDRAIANTPASEKSVIFGMIIRIIHWQNRVAMFPAVLYVICFCFEASITISTDTHRGMYARHMLKR
jgi:hypothetical protein